MKWTRALGSSAARVAALYVAVTLAGCGGDDSGEDSSGGAGASGDMTATPTGAGGTTGSSTTGTGSGTGTTGTGTTGADPDAGAAFNPADLISMFQPTCDSTITAETSCGGTTCPAPGMLAALTCTISCCVDNQCGTRSAAEGMVSDCAAPAEPDPSCPAYVGMGMGGNGLELPGCCTPEGVCGVISSISNTCITQSAILTDLQPGGPCDGSGGGDDADAGI